MSHPRSLITYKHGLLVAAVLGLGPLVAACSTPLPVEVPATQVEAEPATLDAQRGRLLYDTHCIACHSRQVHWRDRSIVGSWSDLVVQVDRWQTNAGQHWNSSEIGDVAAYLNSLYYRMPCSAIGCSGASTARWDGPGAASTPIEVAPALWPDAGIRFPLMSQLR